MGEKVVEDGITLKPYFMVSSKRGVDFKVRDGKGVAQPSRKVGVDAIPFYYRPPFGNDDPYIAIKEILPEDEDYSEDIYVALLTEMQECSRALERARAIQKKEMGLNNGQGVRPLQEIIKDPDDEPKVMTREKAAAIRQARREAALKLAEEKKKKALAEGKDFEVTITETLDPNKEVETNEDED